MPNIIFNQETKEFHLQNKRISYILCILQNGQLGHLYFGKRVTHRDSFQHWLQLRTCSHTAYAFEKNFLFSLDCACLFSKRNTDITSNIAKTQH